MHNSTFTATVRSVSEMTFAQQKRLAELLNSLISSTEVDCCIEEKSDAKNQCPHCHYHKIIRWGESGGLQRYRCKECSKTFNALTKTPLAKLRNRGKFADYTRCLQLGLTLREAASYCEISLKTSFRWRHRFLAGPEMHKAQELAGIVEIDETFFRESLKGNQKITHREPRKRGHSPPGTLLVPVLIALDRYGDEADFVLNHPTKAEIYECLHGRIKPDSVMCTDGNPIYKYIARQERVVHKRTIASYYERPPEKAFNIQSLNNYTFRLKTWIKRFYGVGTAYLKNYLAWWRLIDLYHDVKRVVWIEEAVSDGK